HVDQTMQGHGLTPSTSMCRVRCDDVVTLVNTELAFVSHHGSSVCCVSACVSRATSCTADTVSGSPSPETLDCRHLLWKARTTAAVSSSNLPCEGTVYPIVARS